MESYRDDDSEYEEYFVDSKEDEADVTTTVVSTLASASKIFIYIGIGIAIILLIYFLVSLKFLNMFIYIIGLIVAYFFGYFFMFCLDTFISNN